MDIKKDATASAEQNEATATTPKKVTTAAKTPVTPKTVRTPRATPTSKAAPKPAASATIEQKLPAQETISLQVHDETEPTVEVVSVTFTENNADDSFVIEEIISKKKLKKLKRTLADIKKKEKNKKEKAKAKAKKAAKKAKNKAKKEKAKKKKAAKKKVAAKKKSSSKKKKK